MTVTKQDRVQLNMAKHNSKNRIVTVIYPKKFLLICIFIWWGLEEKRERILNLF